MGEFGAGRLTIIASLVWSIWLTLAGFRSKPGFSALDWTCLAATFAFERLRVDRETGVDGAVERELEDAILSVL